MLVILFIGSIGAVAVYTTYNFFRNNQEDIPDAKRKARAAKRRARLARRAVQRRRSQERERRDKQDWEHPDPNGSYDLNNPWNWDNDSSGWDDHDEYR